MTLRKQISGSPGKKIETSNFMTRSFQRQDDSKGMGSAKEQESEQSQMTPVKTNEKYSS